MGGGRLSAHAALAGSERLPRARVWRRGPVHERCAPRGAAAMRALSRGARSRTRRRSLPSSRRTEPGVSARGTRSLRRGHAAQRDHAAPRGAARSRGARERGAMVREPAASLARAGETLGVRHGRAAAARSAALLSRVPWRGRRPNPRASHGSPANHRSTSSSNCGSSPSAGVAAAATRRSCTPWWTGSNPRSSHSWRMPWRSSHPRLRHLPEWVHMGHFPRQPGFTPNGRPGVANRQRERCAKGAGMSGAKARLRRESTSGAHSVCSEHSLAGPLHRRRRRAAGHRGAALCADG
jgi:hypothetical protein